jgi:hypothetical protein
MGMKSQFPKIKRMMIRMIMTGKNKELSEFKENIKKQLNKLKEDINKQLKS